MSQYFGDLSCYTTPPGKATFDINFTEGQCSEYNIFGELQTQYYRYYDVKVKPIVGWKLRWAEPWADTIWKQSYDNNPDSYYDLSLDLVLKPDGYWHLTGYVQATDPGHITSRSGAYAYFNDYGSHWKDQILSALFEMTLVPSTGIILRDSVTGVILRDLDTGVILRDGNR